MFKVVQYLNLTKTANALFFKVTKNEGRVSKRKLENSKDLSELAGLMVKGGICFKTGAEIVEQNLFHEKPEQDKYLPIQLIFTTAVNNEDVDYPAIIDIKKTVDANKVPYLSEDKANIPDTVLRQLCLYELSLGYGRNN